MNCHQLRFVFAIVVSARAMTVLHAAAPPNFVVIMADDLGYADISCYGDAGYETPHLDRLASEGLRFTDFHSNGAVCSPTRAALLTGRYQQRSGVDGVIYADPQQNRHHGLLPVEVTFADLLRESGYRTGVFGKWHLGYNRRFNPVQNGFDTFAGYVSGNVCYQSHLDRMGIADWWHNGDLAAEDGYSTHLVTQHALEFIEQHQSESFCVYVAHECVHSPYQGPGDPPVRKLGKVGDIRSVARKDIRNAYAEMMIEMDRGIGEIVAKLKELQLERQTLVLFFSDNGANQNGRNTPWRGFKGSLWEGGHRVPCIAWQPKTVPVGTTNVPTMTIDIMPTLLDFAGATIPGGHELDGVSLVSVLTENAALPPRNLYWKYNDKWAVRAHPWKLLAGEGGKNGKPSQLFNLDDDRHEAKDLAAQHPELVRELTERYHAWQAEISLTATKQPAPPEQP